MLRVRRCRATRFAEHPVCESAGIQAEGAVTVMMIRRIPVGHLIEAVVQPWARSLLHTAAALLVSAGAMAQDSAAPVPQIGAGDVSLSPKRVTFNTATRSTAVYVFNRGETAATYSITLVDRLMTPDGRFLTVDEAMKDPADAALAATLQSAAGLIIHTPRRITLQPNESQTVRILAQRPGNLPAGEYRTHLTVTTVPPENYGLTAEQAAGAANEGELSFRLLPLFGISIPLIVRQGPADVRAAIESAQLRLEGPADAPTDAGADRIAMVYLELARLGSSSLYGDIEVRDGDSVLARSAGVAVYPEVERRTLKVALIPRPPSGTVLSIVFIDQDTQPGDELTKAQLIAP